MSDSIPTDPAAEPTGRRGLMIGCAVFALLFAGGGAGALYWFFGPARGTREVLQAQATALGRNDTTGMCRHNSPAFTVQMPCLTYATWFFTNAPWFAGGTVTVRSASASGASDGSVEVTADVRGRRGSGALAFTMIRNGGVWQVAGVRLR